jgi:hypothetical protein
MPTHIDTASEIDSLIELWRKKLLELDAVSAHFKPAPDRWSISEVVGHLVDSACNNHQRFVRAQYCSDFVFPKYEQNEWVAAAHYQAGDWESLVELWYHYKRQSVQPAPDGNIFGHRSVNIVVRPSSAFVCCSHGGFIA